MKESRRWVVLGVFTLLVAAGCAVVMYAQTTGTGGHKGRSYLVTATDSSGEFQSREVITLHSDHTISEINSSQGGPSYYFTSELGTWKWVGKNKIVAEAIDFDLPPNLRDLARLDFTFTLSGDRSQLTGNGTVLYFPLETENPFGSGGTVIGTSIMTGQRIPSSISQ